MRKWLSRLTFSFLVIAAACGFEAWEGFSGRRPARANWQNGVLGAVSAVAAVFFLIAVRIRHSSQSPPD